MELIIVVDDINEVVRTEVMAYAQRVHKEMRRLSKRVFSKKMALSYNANLDSPHFDGDDVVMELNGFLPVAMEDGLDSFDMKPSLLRSSKAKISKKGIKYMNIPVNKAAFKDPYLKLMGVSPFRTVSSNSPADSWIHPGFKARDLFSKAIHRIN